MRGHMLGTTVALCAAALFTAALAPASAAPAASPRAAHAVQRQPSQPVIVDCVWQPHVRPGDFMIACGDGNSYLSKLHWSH